MMEYSTDMENHILRNIFYRQCYLFKFILFTYFLGRAVQMRDLSSPIRYRTCAPCIGSTES